MQQKILELLEQKSYQPTHKDWLFALLHTDEDQSVFQQALQELEQNGDIIVLNNKIHLPKKVGYVKGKITIKEKGFGFVLAEDDTLGDVFVPKQNTNNAMNNDLVMVKVTTSPFGELREGEVYKILKRNTKYLIGTLLKKEDAFTLSYSDPRVNLAAHIAAKDTNQALEDFVVKVEITQYNDDGSVNAKVIETLGHINDPGIDILSAVRHYDLLTEFDPKTLQEANAIDDVIQEKDYVGRRDLRNEIIVTIDGEDAKDLDDAIDVSFRDGFYHLGVHIADVSYYVTPSSALDKEAYERSTSVYLVDRVIPMIPHRISNGICSLNPHVDRLTLSCTMKIDVFGNVVSHEIFPSVIKTTHRLSYTEVNHMLVQKRKKVIKRYEDVYPMLKTALDLAHILRGKRKDRGAIDFETNEAKIEVDKEGNVLNITPRTRDEAEMLIEDFMLLANETVATHMHVLALPSIYRIHEKPDVKKLDRALKIVKSVGHNIKGTSANVHPKSMQKLMEQLEGKKEGKVINTMLLRAMMKAKYSEQNLGHYGLAAEYYTHFTSPIRRYPDLMLHRLIRTFLFNQNDLDNTISFYKKRLPVVALHTSEKERIAIECERAVNDMKKAEYMENFIGHEYIGLISSILPFGMFVELDNTVEGLVHVSEMTDDYYVYNEDLMVFVGRRKKDVYRMGDLVKIRVISASKEERQVDFKIIEHITKHKEDVNRSKKSDNKKKYPRKRR